MCGINILIDKKGKLNEDIIIRMNNSIIHRGPDNAGYKAYKIGNTKVYLGSTRLKVIDSSDSANQPFTSGEHYALVYNGELYNYKSLRNSTTHYKFSTSSDTEVVFSQLVSNGENALNAFNGMYTLAFLDAEDATLLLARDYPGIKPLFYYEDENYFLASSEIKALFASGLVNKVLNEKQIYHYIKYKFAQKPDTFFKNIKELPGGYYLTYDLHNHSVKISTSAKVKKSIQHGNEVHQLKELLLDSLQRQLQADVPVGLFLSGGIDSTLLLALIAELGQKIPCFSINNKAADRNFGTKDDHYSRLAAKKYGSHIEEIIADEHLLNNFDDVISHMDQPVADSSALLTYKLSNFVSKKATVALSGAGADELFAGYYRHSAFNFYLNHLHNKKSLINLLKKIRLPDGTSMPGRKLFRHGNRFFSALSDDPSIVADGFVSMQTRINFEIQKFTGETSLIALLEFDREHYLPSDVLYLTDLMSMAHSLEVRVPYLDKEIINFTESLPAEFLMKKGRKWLLKEILNSMGGEEFAKRPKEGFGIALKPWLEKRKGKELLEPLRDTASPIYQFIPHQLVVNMVQQYREDERDYTSEIWSFIVLHHWLESQQF